VAEKRTHHELGGATVTDFNHAWAGHFGCDNGGPPELMLRVMHHVSHGNPRFFTSQAGDQKPKIGKSLKRRFFGDCL
jgi:hypothetical protein